MLNLRLEQTADLDIETIFEQGLRQFGLSQAELYHDELYRQFELLGEYPGLGRPIHSVKYPGAQKFGFGSHIIVFSHGDTTLTVHRIFHARSNYTRYL